MPSPQGPNSASAMRATWRNSAACLDEDPDLSSLSGTRAPRCTGQMTPRPSAVSVRSLRPAGSALWGPVRRPACLAGSARTNAAP
jgi:hypothetical protein